MVETTLKITELGDDITLTIRPHTSDLDVLVIKLDDGQRDQIMYLNKAQMNQIGQHLVDIWDLIKGE